MNKLKKVSWKTRKKFKKNNQNSRLREMKGTKDPKTVIKKRRVQKKIWSGESGVLKMHSRPKGGLLGDGWHDCKLGGRKKCQAKKKSRWTRNRNAAARNTGGP